MKKLACVLWIAATAGCSTYSLEELRQAEEKGNAFQNALAREYLAFAEAEAKDYDWIDSMYFADKGLMAIYGKDVPPEDLKDWDIPEAMRESLEKAHEQLAALTPEMLQSQPETAAAAQASFDCWVEQQEENWQDDDIAACRDRFAQSMQELSGKTEAAEAVPESPPPAQREAPRGESTSYVVFFQWNSSSLSASGLKVVDEVVGMVAGKEGYEIVLHGHSDSSGDAQANLKLSQRRVEAVKQRLLSGGVKPDTVKSFAYGESDPHVKTADNVQEPANRRVEVFLND